MRLKENMSGLDNIQSSAAMQYKFLFGLTKCSSVLLAGNFSDAVVRDFEYVFQRVIRIDGRNYFKYGGINESKYDLVLINNYPHASQWVHFDETLINVHKSLGAAGILLIHAPNILSIATIKKMLGGWKWPAGTTVWKYRKFIKSSGFNFVEEFVVLPNIDFPEEYISSRLKTIELRVDFRRLLKWLNRFGLYRYVHDGFLYIAAESAANSFSKRMNEIKQSIPEHLMSDVKSLEIEKFYLRDRGAMLLILTNLDTATSIVVKIATTPEINEILSRNMEAINNIRKLPDISTYIISKIPKIVKVNNIHEAWVYIEEKKPGVVLWKLEGNRTLGRQAYEGSFEFIHRFNLETVTQKIISEAVFDQLFGINLAFIERIFADRSLYDICRIRDLLYAHFFGRSVSLVIGHGDYGPGNILCDVSSGEVLSVIDWDINIKTELPAVDFLNLMIQRCCKIKKLTLVDAIKEIELHIASTGMIDESINGYNEKDFGLTTKDLIVYLSVAAIRYINRSLPYQKELIDYSDEYIKVLSAIRRILEDL